MFPVVLCQYIRKLKERVRDSEIITLELGMYQIIIIDKLLHLPTNYLKSLYIFYFFSPRFLVLMGGYFRKATMVEGIGDELIYAFIVLLALIVPLVMYLIRLR